MAAGEKSPMDLPSDELAAKYSSVARNKALEPKVREAAMLFAVAERHLRKEEGDECFQATMDALGIFKDVGDATGIADSLRCMIHYYQMVDNSKDALAMAAEEMKNFSSQGEKRGEACMMLSIAEVSYDKFGIKKREGALESALESLELFKQVGDANMQGHAFMCVARVHVKMGVETKEDDEFQSALDAVQSGLEKFREVGDRYNEGKALHELGIVRAHQKRYKEAVESADAAVAVWTELALRPQVAVELTCKGQWYLMEGSYTDALLAGQEAVTIIQTVGGSRGMEAAAVGVVVQAYIELKDPGQAEKIAERKAAQFQTQGDIVGEYAAFDGILAASISRGDVEEALKAAEKALKAVGDVKKRSPHDIRFEAAIREATARVYLANDQFSKAAAAATEALKTFRETESQEDEAIVLTTLSQAQVGLNETRDAIKSANDAKQLFKDTNNREGIAVAGMALCGALCLKGDVSKAAREAVQAQNIFAELGQRKGEADAGFLLAQVYIMLGDLAKAGVAAKKSLGLFRDADLRKEECAMSVVLAQVHFLAGIEENPGRLAEVFTMSPAWETALKSAKDAVNLCKKSNDDNLIAQGMSILAQVYTMTRQFESAQTMIDDAIAYSTKGGHLRTEGYLQIHMAQMHYMMEKNDKANEVATKALAIFKQAGDAQGEDIAQEMVTWTETGGAAAEGEYDGPAQEMLLSTITDVALSLIGSESLSGDTPLMDAGLDSLASVEFQNTLAKEFLGVNLPSTLVFDFPTPSQIAEFVYTGLRDAAKRGIAIKK